MKRDKIIVNDRQLACARIASAEGQDYLKGMAAAGNYAWVNRSSMTFLTRQVGAELSLMQIFLLLHSRHREQRVVALFNLISFLCFLNCFFLERLVQSCSRDNLSKPSQHHWIVLGRSHFSSVFENALSWKKRIQENWAFCR